MRPSTSLSLLTVPFDGMGSPPCKYKCGKKVTYDGNACQACAKKNGFNSGDFTGKLKAANDKGSACPSERAGASSGASPTKRAGASFD